MTANSSNSHVKYNSEVRQQLKNEMKATASRLNELVTTRQKSILSSISAKYEEQIKLRMDQCHLRSN